MDDLTNPIPLLFGVTRQPGSAIVWLIPTPAPCPLTPLVLNIVRLAAEGYSNREIGLATNRAEMTVKANLRRCYRTLGVPGRVDAVMMALRNGWIK